MNLLVKIPKFLAKISNTYYSKISNLMKSLKRDKEIEK
jgi:hypothetical protein